MLEWATCPRPIRLRVHVWIVGNMINREKGLTMLEGAQVFKEITE
jgi:hypothetical protein